MDTENEDLEVAELVTEDSKEGEEKDSVDKPEVEPEVVIDEEVEADSKQGTDRYDEYSKLPDKEKVKYGF